MRNHTAVLYNETFARAFITLVSMLGSLLVVTIVGSVLQTDQWLLLLALGAGVPLVVAPLVSFPYLRVISRLTAARERERQLCDRDPLTGIYNRRGFLERVQQEVERIHRYGGKLALMLVDVDGFSVINERAGHVAGDLVLVELAKTCADAVRKSDLVGRFGDDEIAILLTEVELGSARTTATRLLELANALRVPAVGQEVAVQVSIGLACFDSDEEEGLAGFLVRAENSLREAQLSGGGQLAVLE